MEDISVSSTVLRALCMPEDGRQFDTGWIRPREVGPLLTAGERLQNELREKGVETTCIEVSDAKAFKEILLFPKQKPVEPPVRVYRGINYLNTDVLRQASYVLRSREKEYDKGVVILDHAREAVERLVNEPTHENLLAYMETIWPDVNDRELKRLEKELIRLEDGVLNEGWSIRLQLTHNTYEFTGGYYTDMGLTPYLSGATTPDMAAGYGCGAVMVLDLPPSRVEARATSANRETAIKTAIDPEYITALLIRDGSESHIDFKKVGEEVRRAVEIVDETLDYKPLSDADLETKMRSIRIEEEAIDAQNREKDLLSIQNRRAKLIVRTLGLNPFPEDIIIDTMQAEALDRYSAVKQLIYDGFVDRFVQAGGRREVLTKEFEYDTVLGENFTRTPLYCDRKRITDKMLQKMKRCVEYTEQRHM